MSPPVFGLPKSPHFDTIARPAERRTEAFKPDRDGATYRDGHGRWSVKYRSWILVGAVLFAVAFLLTFLGIGQVPRQPAEPSADKNQKQLEANAVVKPESAERQSLTEARMSRPSEPTDVAGQYKLALNYLQGSGGFEKSDAQAEKWFRKSADQGYALAQNSLGFMYEKGRGGLARDDVRAVHWYEKAADQGLALAQNNLGRMYLEGRGGLAKDETLAAAWFMKAANQGDALGQVFLGGMYEEGRGGLSKNDAQAAKWFRKAADQGYPLGQYSLGVMYRDGRGGLAKSKAQAAKWFKRAADQGYVPARIALAKIKE